MLEPILLLLGDEPDVPIGDLLVVTFPDAITQRAAPPQHRRLVVRWLADRHHNMNHLHAP